MEQQTITRKSHVKSDLDRLQHLFAEEPIEVQVHWLVEQYLQYKVSFPIIEFLVVSCYPHIDDANFWPFLDRLIEEDYIGTYVFAGKAIQLHTKHDNVIAMHKVTANMIRANVWHACDSMAERVIGEGLLQYFDVFYPMCRKALEDPNDWPVRAVGTASHYAVKKGLPAEQVSLLFVMLCEQKDRKEYHVKKGIGWGVKTISKYYPSMVQAKQDLWKDAPTWFLSKLEKGKFLAAKYAKDRA